MTEIALVLLVGAKVAMPPLVGAESRALDDHMQNRPPNQDLVLDDIDEAIQIEIIARRKTQGSPNINKAI